jgi:hypothetical protein
MAKHTGTQKNIRFSEEELALLDRMTERHESMKAAIIAGLYALEARNEPSNSELIDMLKARLK